MNMFMEKQVSNGFHFWLWNVFFSKNGCSLFKLRMEIHKLLLEHFIYIFFLLYLYIYSLHVKQKPSKACKVKSHAGLEAKATESRGLQQQGTKAQNWWCPVACLVHKPTNLAF